MATSAMVVKAALKVTLDGLPELADLQKTWGFPSRDPEKRWAFLGDITWDSTDWATNRGQNESYSIAVFLNVQSASASCEEVELELVGLGDVLQDALKATPKQGVPNVITSVLRPVRVASWPIPDGVEGQYELAFNVTARI